MGPRVPRPYITALHGYVIPLERRGQTLPGSLFWTLLLFTSSCFSDRLANVRRFRQLHWERWQSSSHCRYDTTRSDVSVVACSTRHEPCRHLTSATTEYARSVDDRFTASSPCERSTCDITGLSLLTSSRSPVSSAIPAHKSTSTSPKIRGSVTASSGQ